VHLGGAAGDTLIWPHEALRLVLDFANEHGFPDLRNLVLGYYENSDPLTARQLEEMGSLCSSLETIELHGAQEPLEPLRAFRRLRRLVLVVLLSFRRWLIDEAVELALSTPTKEDQLARTVRAYFVNRRARRGQLRSLSEVFRGGEEAAAA
ncbi:hypothetical protein HK405_014461, partial [Cladochytrium tenue]